MRWVREINWWSVVPIVLSLALVAFTATMCAATLF